MEVVALKLLSGFIFFIVATIFGFLPFLIHRKYEDMNNSRAQKATEPGVFVQYLHALASGVLIATCLLHLLPESLENVKKALIKQSEAEVKLTNYHQGNITVDDFISLTTNDSSSNDSNSILMPQTQTIETPSTSTPLSHDVEVSFYPLAEFLVALGFLSIYIIDSSIKTFQLYKSKSYDVIHYSPVNRVDNDDDDEDDDNESEDDYHFDKTLLPRPKRNKAILDHDRESIIPRSACYPDNNDHTPRRSKSSSDLKISLHSSHRIGSHCNQPMGPKHLRSVALVTALCIHGFFDGVMVGLQTSLSMLYSLLLALCLHKAFVSFSLSLTLYRNYLEERSLFRYYVYIVSFASVAPLGVIVSSAFVHSQVESGENIGLFPGCVQAFAVGTFFYVTFTEATTRHGEGKHTSIQSEILSHVCLLLGFFFMAAMRTVLDES